MSEKVIAKGPKCRRPFPLHLSSHLQNKPKFALFFVSSQNNWKPWRNRLGHPNSKTILSLFRTVLINKNIVSSHDVLLDMLPIKKDFSIMIQTSHVF